MRSLYYSFLYSYLNYGNIAWCNTSITKITKLYSKQAIKAFPVTSEDYSDLQIEDLMEKTGILNIYKFNIYHVINLMFRVKNNTIPEAFVNKFEIIIITKQGIVKTTSLNLKYILRLPSLQDLHMDHVSGIALLIKI